MLGIEIVGLELWLNLWDDRDRFLYRVECFFFFFNFYEERTWFVNSDKVLIKCQKCRISIMIFEDF